MATQVLGTNRIHLPSPRTKARRIRRIPISVLPRQYRRITEPELVDLLKGRKTILKTNDTLHKATLNACQSCIDAAFYDVNLREQIDLATWQALLMRIPDIHPWTYMDKVSAEIIQAVQELFCFHNGAHSGKYNVLHLYCHHHKRVEYWSIQWSRVAYISLMRPSHEEWVNLVSRGSERSHLCHNQHCQHPFHSTYESNLANRQRNRCWLAVKKLVVAGKSGKSVLRTAQGRCQHDPKCWPPTSIPFISDEDTIRMAASSIIL